VSPGGTPRISTANSSTAGPLARAWRPSGAGRVDAWRVRQVCAKTYDRSWPDGTVSPGITQYSLVRPARSRSRTPSEHLA
jgi:hypothetical protein